MPTPTSEPDDNDAYLASAEFEEELIKDDGLAARLHLEAGYPIYYIDNNHPDAIVKEHPDGCKQLVSVDEDGKITVVHDL